MSNAGQRELLETIRQRSQIAMLQYALLGSVFASDSAEQAIPDKSKKADCPLPPWHPICALWRKDDPARHIRIPFLKYFGNHAPAAWLSGMGRDFATAVQLHTQVTQEVSALLARSRSAGLERGGDAESRADETWGPGSWQQRLLVTQAELVASSPEAAVPGCRNGKHGCLVQSATPGSIDAVFPVPSDESAALAWSFRCAWE